MEHLSYNFNGIAYNGSGGVPVKSTNLGYDGVTFVSLYPKWIYFIQVSTEAGNSSQKIIIQ